MLFSSRVVVVEPEASSHDSVIVQWPGWSVKSGYATTLPDERTSACLAWLPTANWCPSKYTRRSRGTRRRRRRRRRKLTTAKRSVTLSHIRLGKSCHSVTSDFAMITWREMMGWRGVKHMINIVILKKLKKSKNLFLKFRKFTKNTFYE